MSAYQFVWLILGSIGIGTILNAVTRWGLRRLPPRARQWPNG